MSIVTSLLFHFHFIFIILHNMIQIIEKLPTARSILVFGGAIRHGIESAPGTVGCKAFLLQLLQPPSGGARL